MKRAVKGTNHKAVQKHSNFFGFFRHISAIGIKLIKKKPEGL